MEKRSIVERLEKLEKDHDDMKWRLGRVAGQATESQARWDSYDTWSVVTGVAILVVIIIGLALKLREGESS